jgi:hypothetical protein
MSKTSEFLKRAKESKKNNILTFPLNETICGELVSTRQIDNKLSGGKQDILKLKNEGGDIMEYYSYSLLSWIIKNNKVQNGDIMAICKTDRQKIKGTKFSAFGCDFYSEPDRLKKGAKK